MTDLHRAQLLSYLKLGRYRVGYLLNFNVKMLKNGICRLANGFRPTLDRSAYLRDLRGSS